MRRFAFAVALALSAAAGTAHAVVVPWTASLTPENEVPPVDVPAPGATGSAMGTLDTDSNLLSWEVMWSGLTGPAINAHFHVAPPGVAGPAVVNIGALSGLTSPSIGSTTVSDSVEADLLSRLLYINVHTDLNPPGEIRGQVNVIPLPATLPLLFAALGITWFVRRRPA